MKKIIILFICLFAFAKSKPPPPHTQIQDNKPLKQNSKQENKDEDNAQNPKFKAYELEAVTIEVSTFGEYQKYQTGQVLDDKMLESAPSGNGDITSILRTLPNVQFDNSQLKSTVPGEIDPANISISGGLYYQNNFQLDGFNMNNDLNPLGSAIGGTRADSTTVNNTPGRSQGLNIDTSLLESITVLDSNIGAAYGGFTGGVVEANTRRPKKDFGASINYQISQGNANPNAFSLTQYKIPQEDLNSFLNSSNSAQQPHFIKHSFRSSIESKINDKLGIIGSFTTMQSFIYLNAGDSEYLKNTLEGIKKTQKRQSYNFFIKGNYDYSDTLSLELSYAYAPQYNNYFLAGVKDSSFDFLTGGHQLGSKSFWQNALGLLSTQASFSYMDSSRTNSENYFAYWRPSAEKNWTVDKSAAQTYKWPQEGGYGNIDQKQINVNLKTQQDFEALQTSILTHNFSVGAEFGYVNAYYERVEDFWWGSYFKLRPLKQGQSCLDGDRFCSASSVYYETGEWKDNKGQFVGSGSMYKKGKIALDSVTLGGFLQDDIEVDLSKAGTINVRAGLRLDYDTYMSKATLAPRLSLKYIAPWSAWEYGKNFGTQITFGANRYYGRNLFAYRLADGQSALEYGISRSIPEAWSYESRRSTTNFQKIKVPYSDELMAGISQEVYMFALNLKYIVRKGRDEVRRMCADANGNLLASSSQCNAETKYTARYIYTNEGRSDSDILSIMFGNEAPIKLGAMDNFFMLSYDRTNIYRNYTDFNTNITQAELNNETIYYEGIGFIKLADKPGSNFAQPITFRLSTTHIFPFYKTKWSMNNFFRIRSAYNAMARIEKDSKQYPDKVKKDDKGVPVDTYIKFKVPWTFSWDMRFGVDVNVWRGNTLNLAVDIFNLLNTTNMYLLSGDYGRASGSPMYETGRQFWISVGYKY